MESWLTNMRMMHRTSAQPSGCTPLPILSNERQHSSSMSLRDCSGHLHLAHSLRDANGALTDYNERQEP